MREPWAQRVSRGSKPPGRGAHEAEGILEHVAGCLQARPHADAHAHQRRARSAAAASCAWRAAASMRTSTHARTHARKARRPHDSAPTDAHAPSLDLPTFLRFLIQWKSFRLLLEKFSSTGTSTSASSSRSQTRMPSVETTTKTSRFGMLRVCNAQGIRG